MTQRKSADNSYTDATGKFRAGNPGKPQGTRHKATRAAEALLEGEAEALTRKAIEAALEGDIAALRICLDRIVPIRKSRPIQFDIGALENAADLSAAARKLLEVGAPGRVHCITQGAPT